MKKVAFVVLILVGPLFVFAQNLNGDLFNNLTNVEYISTWDEISSDGIGVILCGEDSLVFTNVKYISHHIYDGKEGVWPSNTKCVYYTDGNEFEVVYGGVTVEYFDDQPSQVSLMIFFYEGDNKYPTSQISDTSFVYLLDEIPVLTVVHRKLQIDYLHFQMPQGVVEIKDNKLIFLKRK